MKTKAICILAALGVAAPLLAGIPARGTRQTGGQKVRFVPVRIYLDSGDKPLAAYQFELKARTGQIKIVGVEGGDPRAFREAPYYDPAALANDRIVIAAFNTGSDLPHGRTRVATIHLQILGDTDPEWELGLSVAVDAEGHSVDAVLSMEIGVRK